ncbi:hypothetical protein CC85DRAFT_282218 [Cutaneotrichosporon oleaginosum]|uniref:Calcium/proton exchanger n=1 Tax=Cutaneotrichosporon oleaginosum TaxID=879819 RepID=A0A0J0XX12_9TREE|nr:uncharacterized protein CC85DRAFT_282218 [Cutaneotrichosporon oleaginosum]KLT45596.1 hypothetical protein CC85DRAFT_282218 [Cutaneotrichosporon oleaginosum]TXT04607.1 hypothetical protein COLE_07426 [Cutaneotrichosporon oleaginosum]
MPDKDKESTGTSPPPAPPPPSSSLTASGRLGQQAQGSAQSSAAAAGPASSPTPTIRPPARVQPPSPLGLSGMPPHTFSATTPQRSLGRGRPRPPTNFGIGGISTPQTPLSPSPDPPGMPIPRRHRGSNASSVTDEEDHATPRNTGYFPQMPESRRVSEVRGLPSGAQSPLPPTAGSIGQGRAPRPKLTTTAPASAAPSRSASRVRLPQLKDMDDDEDDELNVTDRGEELIRRRQKERKRAKRERERRALAEMEVGEEDEAGDNLPASAMSEGSVLMSQPGQSPVRGYNQSSSSSRHRAAGGSRLVSGSALLSPRPASESVEREPSSAGRPRAESVQSRAVDDDESRERLAVPPVEVDATTDGYHSDSEGSAMDDDEDSDDASPDDGEGVTVKDRQDAINIEHPFGLPIWKPALYRKSRSVTRNAEAALHSAPTSDSHNLLLGNIFWLVAFGWWLALVCLFAAMLVSGAEVLAGGRGGYGRLTRGLAWYIWWPFGKYVEGEGAPHEDSSSSDEEVHHDEENNTSSYGATSSSNTPRRALSASTSSSTTVRQTAASALDMLPDEPHTPQNQASISAQQAGRKHGVSFAPGCKIGTPDLENVPLLGKPPATACFRKHVNKRAKFAGSLVYWPVFFLIIAPTMLTICIICWFLVVTIPMAKLNWELLELLWNRPLEIGFRPAPTVPVYDLPPASDNSENGNGDVSDSPIGYTLRRVRINAGQVAPTPGPASTVLLCVYRAVGIQYCKYTVGGVNIMFINLMPIVFFAIIDGLIILPAVEHRHEHHQSVPKWLDFIANPALVFLLGLASVIPLSYFIGMAVASISAQSSIGMGAVINATFGSIIEIVLYGIALTQGKGRLVEGSIVGSILAGVLLMPGMSMCSGALKRKEQKFNAKSAGVTSTMLIMAIIGVLTPTMFYQSYGNFQLRCEGCPQPDDGGVLNPGDSWRCDRCWYQHPAPESDPFYQSNVKILMYICAGILLLSYLIGLWFSLRTHASQIWQNPQQLMQKEAEQLQIPRAHLARITPANLNNPILPVHSKPESIRDGVSPMRPMTMSIAQSSSHAKNAAPHRPDASPRPGTSPVKYGAQASPRQPLRPELGEQAGGQAQTVHTGYTPYLQALEQNRNMDPMALGPQLTSEDFRRAVRTLAAVTELQRKGEAHPHMEEAGGHEAPSWTRGMSAAVLLGCTLLYAAIAEVLVDVVDVVLAGSGVDEKFLGLTLFALVPNTTEFMNAMSFAMNGNIALSMEIGSAYALQVCLLQIPAMVAFSAWYSPKEFGDVVDTFTLIFPRWDVIAIILGIFLLTYTYIEARSNYHRGSILVLSYCVLMLGFYFAPVRDNEDEGIIVGGPWATAAGSVADTMAVAITKLWA